MRGLLIGCVVALACLIAANTATAADVSDQTLAVMGLSDMTPLSDAQGMEVRGLGYVSAWGSALSSQGYGNTAFAAYDVGSSPWWGDALAVGGALAITHKSGWFGGTNVAFAISGGFAR